MIRAVIVDDEQHCINHLTRLLEKHTGHIELAGSFQTVNDGLHGILNLTPDLIFLDVQIHRETGFDLLSRIKEKKFEIIFTTAFDRFAVQAFKFSALDYLLKPVDPDDLSAALKKIKPSVTHSGFNEQINNLLFNIRSASQQLQRICLPVLNGMVFLNVSDIIRLKSDSNYTQFFLKDGKKIMVSRTLKEFDELLSENNFFRIHQSHLINLACIKQYTKGKGGYVTMTDGAEIEVSVRKKEEFLKQVMNM
ncbi:MAG: response regulator transcription factor [Bacteroidia bacterium]|nr:response regulator transcription factor [Bacteroidia bacterium]